MNVPAEALAGGLSVTVNVTELEPLTVIVGVLSTIDTPVDRAFTVCVAEATVALSAKVAGVSEWYAAVIVCEPTASTEVVNVASPAPSTIVLPTNAPLSKKETVPVGTEAGTSTSATVAVSDAACPNVDAVVAPRVVVVVSA